MRIFVMRKGQRGNKPRETAATAQMRSQVLGLDHGNREVIAVQNRDKFLRVMHIGSDIAIDPDTANALRYAGTLEKSPKAVRVLAHRPNDRGGFILGIHYESGQAISPDQRT